MHRFRRILLLCVFSTGSATALHHPNPEPQVDVCLRIHTSVSMEVLQFGEATASQLFEDIGVRLRWSCGRSPGQVDIGVADRTPHDFHRGAFAYAMPYAPGGERVVVFYDRFVPLTITNPNTAPIVLGHILAHELGHVLCGVASHADSGLMRAKWSGEDIGLMRLHKFRFTPEIGRFIQENLSRRK
jgi:hypothetical protein